ncbi:hypothetical protein C8261_04945 [Pseudothauera lacus]|uniref:SPOR domain-containing protein n=1 Tax=Pseudothauera lacus TaxID=2136175 RepID=A0A2T4IHV5_9RHOO|nr:hypothetical protein C8261_04945 [Pseudothauera lacus]
MLVATPPVYAAPLDEDNLLLLDVMLERQRLASSITAYRHQGKVLVSLAELGGALEFPIDVNSATGLASGWFLSQDRRFELDLATRQVTINGQVRSFTADEVVASSDGIFVAMDTLARWFPTDLELQMSTLSIAVKPREMLPVQAREARRRQGAQVSAVGPASLPPVDNSYRALGPHALDLGIGYSVHRSEDSGRPRTGINYSALLAGDVAYMDSRVYFSGNKDDALSDFRASLSRDGLNGPLGLRYVEVGDIVPPQVAGVAGSAAERGILIQGGGSAVGRDDLIDGDTIRIVGDALTGWDVELFQNGMRVGFQTVGPDGRYVFENIEPLFGENQFELVFYGPNGEERREKVSRFSGLTPDQPGSVRYQLAVSQKGEQLYDASPTEHESGIDPVSNRGSLRYAAGVDLRVLQQMSVRAAWNSVVIDDQRRNYLMLGTRLGLGPATLGLDGTRGPSGGTRWDASLHLPGGVRLWGFDTRFVHSHFANYIPQNESDEEVRNLSSRTSVIVTGPVGTVNTRFAVSHNRSNDSRYNSYSAGFTSFAAGVHFGSNLVYDQYEQGSGAVQRENALYGDVFFTTRTGPLSIRGGSNYMLRPDRDITRYYIDSNLRVAQDMTMNFGLSHDPLRDLTRFTAGFNWRLPQFTLSPRLSYDSDGEYSGFVYLTMSMGPRPDRPSVLFSGRSLAGNGTVIARVFLDRDGSGTFTEGDTPLPGVKVVAPQAVRNVETDREGVAQLTGLFSDRPTDVLVDEKTLPHPSMRALHGGNSVLARPATTTLIDFPVVLTGEIEGRVHAQRGSSRSALAGALVELIDAKGSVYAFKASAHDGFFAFDGIPFGTYQLRFGGARGANSESLSVVISEASPYRSGLQLIARENGVAASSLAPIAQLSPLVSADVSAEQPLVPAQVAQTAAVRPAAHTAQTRGRMPAVGSDGRIVQLGAYSSVDNAENALRLMRSRTLVGSEDVQIIALATDARGVLHRILMSPGRLSAEASCRSIKARGGSCITVDPARR